MRSVFPHQCLASGWYTDHHVELAGESCNQDLEAGHQSGEKSRLGLGSSLFYSLIGGSTDMVDRRGTSESALRRTRAVGRQIGKRRDIAKAFGPIGVCLFGLGALSHQRTTIPCRHDHGVREWR